jgi:hypothetical protein
MVTTTLVTLVILASSSFSLDAGFQSSFTFPAISTQSAPTNLAPASEQPTPLSSEHQPLAPAFDSALDLCPVLCYLAGHNPTNWTIYHDVERMHWCNQTMLLDFAIHNPIDDPNTHVTLRSCSVGEHANAIQNPSPLKQDIDMTFLVGSNGQDTEVSMQTASLGDFSLENGKSVAATIGSILDYLAQRIVDQKSVALFASSRVATVGIYVGSKIRAQGVAITVLKQLIDDTQHYGVSERYLVQLCGSNNGGSDFALGIAVDMNDNLDFVQMATSKWSEGDCLTAYQNQTMQISSGNNITVWLPTPSTNSSHSATIKQSNSTSTTLSKKKRATNAVDAINSRDGDCTTIQVASGDDCGKLASRCQISGFDFERFNNPIHASLCATLVPGERVCCTEGSLPDLSPKPNPDSSCATYLVVADDSCSKLEGLYSLTTLQIETYNKNTWGWSGCNNLQIGVKMCLSIGTPPFPPPAANAICGPQIVGTLPSPPKLPEALNPCPLNACCNIWVCE